MPKPPTYTQTLENRAFLKTLTRTGNIREAARAIGRSHVTMLGRRKAHPAFAQDWDAAIAVAQGRLHERGGPSGPHGRAAPAESPAGAHRTLGGEPVTVRRRDGKLQLRRAQPGKLTKQCEQAFLAALSATANVRLSAAAAGASPRAFYRRRHTNPAFAREMRLALETGYERLEMALLESAAPAAHADDAWRNNDPPPIPRMSVNQALQLLYLHQKEAQLEAEPAHIKRRRGESQGARSIRLSAMYEARMERDREAFRVAEAARRAAGRPSPFGPPPPQLPALDQVQGWSRADPTRTPHDETRALFGGWRIEDMKRRGKS
ncbi:hypothetical protein D1610_10400 [Sphingomonas gilva]|uniref:Uncharacterized protein n=1 Tax=Sphingomonas gilva TaxID=2305907 RepID=A0A396RNN0_9SPHN|nr:hypothetical protein [Sphingomonas gilva]RHW17376.1 hypothetical protein D1610_10400 [Sphingomonas gilva]